MVNSDDIQRCLQKLPDVGDLFKNQQKYLHLYLFHKGIEITAEKLKDLLLPFKPGFSEATYYGVRRWLMAKGYSSEGQERSTGKRGPIEISHRLVDDAVKQDEFRELLLKSGMVTRPVGIGKYQLLRLLLLRGEVSKQLSVYRMAKDGRGIRRVAGLTLKTLFLYKDRVFFPICLLQGFLELSVDLFRAAEEIDDSTGASVDVLAGGEQDGEKTVVQLEYVKSAMPEAVRFFKYQQRFLHLFMFAAGEEVTSDRVARVCRLLDRSFSRNTYSQVKKWLFAQGYAREGETESSNARGPKELSHGLVSQPDKSEELVRRLVEIGMVERPVKISKYLLLELAIRRPHALEDLQSLTGLLALADGTFVPGVLAVRTVRRAIALARSRIRTPLAVPDFYADQGSLRPVVFTGPLLSLHRHGKQGGETLEVDACRGLELIAARGSGESTVSVRTVLKVEGMDCLITINVGLVEGAFNLSLVPGQECRIDPPLAAFCRLLKKRDSGMTELNPAGMDWNSSQNLDRVRELAFTMESDLVVSIAFVRQSMSSREYYGELRIEVDRGEAERGGA